MRSRHREPNTTYPIHVQFIKPIDPHYLDQPRTIPMYTRRKEDKIMQLVYGAACIVVSILIGVGMILAIT